MHIPPAHMTVVEYVTHQPHDHEATAVGSTPFLRMLRSDEQPYVRHATVGEAWQRLDRGWLESAGMLLVENKEGQFTQVQPREEERKAALMRVVEVGLAGANPQPTRFAVVRPAESCRFEPADVTGLWLRCRFGTARVIISLIPE